MAKFNANVIQGEQMYVMGAPTLMLAVTRLDEWFKHGLAQKHGRRSEAEWYIEEVATYNTLYKGTGRASLVNAGLQILYETEKATQTQTPSQ